MIPLAVNPVVYARGTGGAPSTANPLADIRDQLRSYEHTISATGGFESLSLELGTNLDAGLDWLSNLGASVVSYGPHANVIWEGLLASVLLAVGDEKIDLSLDDLANAVAVKYQPGIGQQATTAFGTDATSIALYGRKELVYGGSGMVAAAATALRDAILAQRAYPVSRRSGGASSGGTAKDVSVHLTCMGWFYTLDWLTTSSSTTTTAVTTTQLQNLVTAYNGTNAFFDTTYVDVGASGISDTQYIEDETPYRTKIDRLMSQGNSSGERLAYGVYEGRRWKVAQWAGATPTIVTYQRSLGDGRIYTANGSLVDPWNVRPDAIYQVIDLIDPSAPAGGDSVSAYYVERVTCTINAEGTSVRLEPARSGELDVLLARMR